MKRYSWVWDLVTVAGVALVAAGLGFVYWPLAPIVSGAAMIALGLLGAKSCS